MIKYVFAAVVATLAISPSSATTIYALTKQSDPTNGAIFISPDAASGTGRQSGGTQLFCSLAASCELTFNKYSSNTTALHGSSGSAIDYFKAGNFQNTGLYVDNNGASWNYNLVTIDLPSYSDGSFIYILQEQSDPAKGAIFINSNAASDSGRQSGGTQLFCSLAASCELTFNKYSSNTTALHGSSGSAIDYFRAGDFQNTGLYVDNNGAGWNYNLITIALPNQNFAVPEVSIWLSMILGMGVIGVAMRQRQRTTRVSYIA